MSIQRSGPTPKFGDYLTNYVLIPKGSTLPAASPLFGFHQMKWVEVPSYQRGVAWARENVEEFVESRSVLLGNVILGSFQITPPLQQCFPGTNTPQNYFLLIDGLQRFAVGTAMLAVLQPLVLDANPSMPQLQPHFQPIVGQMSTYASVYLHNDNFLSQYPRDVVKAGYLRVRQEISSYVDGELNSGPADFGASCVRLFLDRQVAIDEYFNFASTIDLMNTFLGINTVRMDLSPVDLLRANIVERAETAGWSTADIETMENDFAEVFTHNNGEKVRTELLPFVGILLSQIDNQTGVNVFPSWNTGLVSTEVDNFFLFISEFLDANDQYFKEIRQCGAIPFAVVLGHYYQIFLSSGSKPTLLTGGVNEHPELHEFLRGVYRAILAGRIGRTKITAENAFGGQFASLADAGDEISQDQSNTALSQTLGLDWIKSSLELADRNRSKRVFNAMLLGPAPHSGGSAGSAYLPLEFGRKAIQYHIDHLLPSSMKAPNSAGSREVDTIRNFAPLPTNENQAAKATSCSTKLAANGIYANHITQPTSHPYCQWLVAHQASYGANLDDQTRLERNANPAIGDERIQEIAAILQQKI